MLRIGITIGTIALTRVSTAGVNQVTHPRLEAPAIINFSGLTIPILGKKS